LTASLRGRARAAGRVFLSGPFVLASVLVALLLGGYAALSSIQTPYQILLPGPVTPIDTLISPFPSTARGGKLLLTTIYSDPADAVEYAAMSVYTKFRADAAVVPREQARPRNVDERQYQRMLGTMMDESKITAQVVALRELGYAVKVTGQGAQIQEVVDNSPAAGALQRGDVITAADGQSVTTSTDLVALIQSHKPQETIRLHVRRDNAERDVLFVLGESPDEPGRARAGIVVMTHLYEYELPKKVDITTRDIGGPSAGLMLALGVYSALSETDVTHGHTVAGTGTISSEGRVGAVGGVKYKAIAVDRAHGDVFLVPPDNLEEARASAGGVRVLPVATFREALEVLAALPPKR
jgi:PDZ domain-containing protein